MFYWAAPVSCAGRRLQDTTLLTELNQKRRRLLLPRYLSSIGLVFMWRLKKMVQLFLVNDCLASAGALTYTTLFAVVPLMTVTYAFFSILPEYAQMFEEVQAYIFQNFVPGGSNIVQEKLAEFAGRARGLTAMGFCFLFVTAFLMLISIEKRFNAIWNVAQPRSGLSRFLVYWGVLSMGPLCIVAGLLSSLYLLSLPLVSDFYVSGLRETVLGYLPVFLSVGGFTLLFYAVPNCRVSLLNAIGGGVATMLIFQGAFTGFASASRWFSYDVVYGTFAALPIFLVWMYLVWLIILVGAIFVRVLALAPPAERDKEPLLIKAVRVLRVFFQAHLEGRAVWDRDIGLEVPMGQDEYRLIMAALQETRIVCQTGADQWTLGRSLQSLTLWDLYGLFPHGLEWQQLNEVKDLPRLVDPLVSLGQFGVDNMSISLESVVST
jgi:membrane protein